MPTPWNHLKRGYANQRGYSRGADPATYLGHEAFREPNEQQEQIALRRTIDVPSERQIEARAAVVRQANLAHMRRLVGGWDGEEAFDTED